jgi:hypothetical protein
VDLQHLKVGSWGMSKLLLLVAACVVAAATPVALAAPAVVIDQALLDQVFEIPGTDYENTIDLDVDAADVQTNPSGLNTEKGDFNLQENHSVPFASDAETVALQSLINNTFNTESAELENSVVRNSVDIAITASDDLTAAVGVNTAAGAFNLQANSSVIAPITGDVLAQSAGNFEQGAQLNAAVVQDVSNEVLSTIVIDAAGANVGINTVSGTGNEQINSATILTNFPPP